MVSLASTCETIYAVVKKVVRVRTQSLLVGNPRCMTSMSLNYSGVTRVLKDCRSLASVSCLASREPCLNTVGDEHGYRGQQERTFRSIAKATPTNHMPLSAPTFDLSISPGLSFEAVASS